MFQRFAKSIVFIWSQHDGGNVEQLKIQQDIHYKQNTIYNSTTLFKLDWVMLKCNQLPHICITLQIKVVVEHRHELLMQEIVQVRLRPHSHCI